MNRFTWILQPQDGQDHERGSHKYPAETSMPIVLVHPGRHTTTNTQRY